MPGLQIINVMAASLDGRIAAHNGETDVEREAMGFTHADDKAHLLELVRSADAVIVGGRSITASGAAFEELNAKGVVPTWVVMSKSGLPPHLPFWAQERVSKWIVSPNPLPLPPLAAAAAAAVQVMGHGAENPARFVQRSLIAAGCRRALLFGGAALNRIFYEENLVDSLWLTVCPLILGQSGAIPLVEGGLSRPTKLSLVHSHSRGDLVFLNYHVHKS